MGKSKALGYGLDDMGSIPSGYRVKIFLFSFIVRLALGLIQLHVN